MSISLCACVYLSPVRVVCPNHDRVMFQPWTGTNLGLGSVAYCYVSNQLIYFQGDIQIMTLFPSHWRPSSIHIVSSAHLGIPCIYTSIPKPLSLHRFVLSHERRPSLKSSPVACITRCSPCPSAPHYFHACIIPVAAATII